MNTSFDWVRLRTILNELSKGKICSGNELSSLLGVSKTSINKSISQLEELGIEIFSIKGKGYKLAQKIALIDEELLKKELEIYNGYYFNSIPSTNKLLIEKSNLSSGDYCISEHQSNGLGRLGRKWISPFASHLYFSLYWRFELGLPQCQGVSLVIACSIAEALTNFNIPVSLKWPNDIYLNNKKLGGILVEVSGDANNVCNLIIGIGINIYMPYSMSLQINQPWIDLSEFNINKTILAIEIHKQLIKNLKLFQEEGLFSFIKIFDSFDLYKNKEVFILIGDKKEHGVYLGINEQGSLLIKQQDEIKTFFAGEVSLRKK